MHPRYWKSGRKQVFYAPMDSEGSTGGGGLDVHAAGDALAALMSDDDGDADAGEPAADTGTVDAPADAEAEPVEGEGKQQDGEPAAETVTVEVDGKTVELTREQIADAYKTSLQQQDLTRESAQVAEQRAAAAAETQKARDERANLAQQLQQFLAASQHHEQQAQQWTAEQIDADPVGYLQSQEANRVRALQTQQAQTQLQQLQQQEQQEREQSHQQYLVQQREAIIKANPEWKDPAKFKAGLDALEPFMIERGFTRNDGPHVFDARFIGVLQDAQKYQDIVARAKDTAQKVAKAPPKVAAPGRQPIAPTDGRTVAMKRLSATGSVTDAASALSLLL